MVYDNKKPGQERAALITRDAGGAVTSQPLAWPQPEPVAVDLEGLTAVPGFPRRFLVATSNGDVVVLEWQPDSDALSFTKALSLPNRADEHEFEGFCIQRIGREYLAVWADRGSATEAAKAYWTSFDPKELQFGELQGPVEIRMPWPSVDVRHISDLKVDASGVMYVSAAADHGDEGPFESAVYVGGSFTRQGSGFALAPNEAPIRLFQTENHKIEALDLVPGYHGGLVFASDDEDLGAYIYFSW